MQYTIKLSTGVKILTKYPNSEIGNTPEDREIFLENKLLVSFHHPAVHHFYILILSKEVSDTIIML